MGVFWYLVGLVEDKIVCVFEGVVVGGVVGFGEGGVGED